MKFINLIIGKKNFIHDVATRFYFLKQKKT